MSLLIKAIAARHHPSGGAFTPASIAGLAGWYDATQIVGLSDGDAVSTWENQAATLGDLTQTSTQRPLYKTGIQNGLPVVRFDGTDDSMQTSVTVLSNPLTWFFACQINNADDDQFYLCDRSDSSGDRNAIYRYLIPGADHYSFYAGTNVNGTVDVIFGQFIVVIAIFNGASSVLYQNGVSAVSGNAGVQGCRGFSLCSTFLTNTYNVDGDIGECGVYQAAISAGDRSNLQDYLVNKWNITI